MLGLYKLHFKKRLKFYKLRLRETEVLKKYHLYKSGNKNVAFNYFDKFSTIKMIAMKHL